MSLKLKNPIPSCSRKICFLKKPTKNPALSVLRFLCKTFSKLLKFTLQNTLLSG